MKEKEREEKNHHHCMGAAWCCDIQYIVGYWGKIPVLPGIRWRHHHWTIIMSMTSEVLLWKGIFDDRFISSLKSTLRNGLEPKRAFASDCSISSHFAPLKFVKSVSQTEQMNHKCMFDIFRWRNSQGRFDVTNSRITKAHVLLKNFHSSITLVRSLHSSS